MLAYISFQLQSRKEDFPGDPVVKNSPANAGDMGSIPGPGRFHVLWSSFIRALKLLNLRAAAADSVLTAGEASSEKPTHHNWTVAPIHCS